jgi:hypothetical protein
MVPILTQIISGENENQENGIYDSGVGEIYRYMYIGFRLLW